MLHRWFFTSLLLLGTAAPSSAAILFLDTFDTSANSLNINFEIASPSMRQSGTMVPGSGISYSETQINSTSDHRTQVNNPGAPNTLFFAPGGSSVNQVSVSPGLDISSVSGPVKVSFTANVGGTDWSMLRFGLSNGERTDNIFNGAIDGGGITFLLRNNGGLQGFVGSSGTLFDAGEDTANVSRQGSTLVELTLSNVTGGAGTAQLKVGGSFVDFDTSGAVNNTYNYGSLGGGYLQLVAFSSTGEKTSSLDNLRIETVVVPEPSSFVIALIGGVFLFCSRRMSARLR